MTPSLLDPTAQRDAEQTVFNFLNNQPYFLSQHTASSPRAAGDAVQSILEQNLGVLLEPFITNYQSAFARRAMEDAAFDDYNGFHYVVDIKAHLENADFSMPNLTSLPRLSRLYEHDKNVFMLLMVHYRATNDKILFTKVQFLPIEYLSWECLTVGALGAGQIQIKDANNISIDPQVRRKWMLILLDKAEAFYKNEIIKANKRLAGLSTLRTLWENKVDQETL